MKLAQKWLTLALALALVLTAAVTTAGAASLSEGSKTVNVAIADRSEILTTQLGTLLRSGIYSYVSDDGLSGPAFCLNHGLHFTSETLPITGKYTANPHAAGAIANGYPVLPLDEFLDLYLADNPILYGLTRAEYSYATQSAVWAALGQLGVEGTDYTAGREFVAEPVEGTPQELRTFRAIQIILEIASQWTRVDEAGMYIRVDQNMLGGNVAVPNYMTLEYAANTGAYGFRAEMINGKPYYTKEYIFASATPTSYNDDYIALWLSGAPEGTMFTDLENVILPTTAWLGDPAWQLQSERRFTSVNENSYEYSATAKLCIPADTAPPSGEITLHCGSYVTQYGIYYVHNDDATEQSFLIADPARGVGSAQAVLSWGSDFTETARLIITKTGATGVPLPGATFTLTSSDSKTYTGTTDSNGEIFWSDIDPSLVYTLTETVPPAGYALTEPITLRLTAGQTRYVTVRDDPASTLTIHKSDAQTGYSLMGAVYTLEQVDGSCRTSAATDAAGNIQFSADQLPLGVYRVYESAAPAGYILDGSIDIVSWDGTRDVSLNYTNVRQQTLIIEKKDVKTGSGLPYATFDVFCDGEFVTSVTTDDTGLARVPGVKDGCYYTAVETIAPEGYELDDTPHGIKIDAYDPAVKDDPRLVITNDALPSLRIVKYDRSAQSPLSDVTFEVFKDASSLGQYRTDSQGEILLEHMEPGTYRAVEVDAGGHPNVLDTTPQEIELRAGDGVRSLVFFNEHLPGLHILKVDAATYQPIPNATFSIRSVAGDYGPVERTTDSGGLIDLSGLPVGVYEIKELSCPGYVIDSATRIIRLDGDEDGRFVFTNTKLPSLTITKYDPMNEIYLPGATIKITRIGGNSFTATKVTDAEGKIILDGLEPGAYCVTEVEAPSGYVTDGREYHINVVAGRNNEVTLINQTRINLTIYKYDAQTKAPLCGATFEVYRDTELIGTHVTGADGTIKLSGLLPGVYTAQEVDAPDSHVINGVPQSIRLEAGQDDAVLMFSNYAKPGLYLIKIDRQTLHPLPNAVFEIALVGGTFQKEFTTDENGEIDLSVLEPGSYTVREITPPDGYLIDDGERIIKLDGGQTGHFIFSNTALPSIRIEKLSADGSPLAGVTFSITRIEDGSRYLDRTTDSNGEILISGLQPGVYSVRETSTVTDHILDDTEYHIELFPSQTSTLTVRNDKLPSLTVFKTDADTDAPIAGAVFEVRAADGHSVDEIQTDAIGKAELKNLLPGVYEITEKSVPSPYLLDAPPQLVTLYPNRNHAVYFENHLKSALIVQKVCSVTGNPLAGAKFHVTYASNNTGSGELRDLGFHDTDEAGRFSISSLEDGWYTIAEVEAPSGYSLKEESRTVFVEAGAGKTVTFENTPLNAITVWKFDTVTGEPIEGTIIQLRYLGGTSGTGGTVIGTYRTNTNGAVIITGLAAGTYVVEEIAIDSGHVIDVAPQTVYLSGKDQDVVEVFLGNSPKGELLVKLVDDATGAPITDASFMVTTADGTVVGNSNGKYFTDSAGSFLVSGIAPGTSLIVKQTDTPDGYIPDRIPQIISSIAGQTVTLEFRNTPLGGVELIKVDASDKAKRLANAVFEIRNASGTLVDTLTTDRYGRAYRSLASGTYCAVEVEAPTGYKSDGTPLYFEVKDGKMTHLAIPNTAVSGILIHKVDSTTGQGIYGVTFLLYDGTNTPIGQYTSDDRGYVYITDLEAGQYYVRELENSGYILDPQRKAVYVEPGKTTEIVWKNIPITGQIQVYKTSEDYNSVNGWPAGTPIPNTVLEIYNARTGELVDTIKTDKNGVASSSPLPLGRYKIIESMAAANYLLDRTPVYVELEYAGQIVKAAMTNKSLYTNVSIQKIGYSEVMLDQSIRYNLLNIANNSNVSLTSFYWRDTLPVEALRLNKIVTGTYSGIGNYKVLYRTNLSGGVWRTMYDNLSTMRNYVLDASPAALGLASNEYVTEFLVSFGVVPANFRQLEVPAVYCDVMSWVQGGATFTNRADVGGIHDGEWIMAASQWMTRVYRPAEPLPKTGY